MSYRWVEYIKQDIWRLNLQGLPWWHRFFIRLLRTIIIISQGFSKKQIQQGASSLTYYTLLAIVPVIALLIGLARGFALENSLRKWLLGRLNDQKEVVAQLFDLADGALKTVHQGIIAFIGIAILVWAAIKVLMYLENFLNKIWEVKRGRPFAKRFTDYMAMLFLSPVVIFLASARPVYLAEVLKNSFFAYYLIPLLNLIPFGVNCLLLTFLYIFMPHTRVRFWPAVGAAIITALMYQLLQTIYFAFQISVTSYNPVYGTFAALPFFLIWVHLSWIVILLGAKISFAFQNADAFDFMSENLHLSHRVRTILLLRISHFCIQTFMESKRPPSIVEISHNLAIPLPLTTHLIFQLINAEILVEIKASNSHDPGFQPACTIDKLTIKYIIDMIETRGEKILLPASKELSMILNSLEKFSQAIERSDGNILLKDI